jgi:hypothetical protein
MKYNYIDFYVKKPECPARKRGVLHRLAIGHQNLISPPLEKVNDRHGEQHENKMGRTEEFQKRGKMACEDSLGSGNHRGRNEGHIL